MIDYNEIGIRIAKARKATGFTQLQVCEMCDISDKYLSNIERSRSIPSLEVVMRICKVLGITPNEILLGTSKTESCDEYSATTDLIKMLDPSQLPLLNDFIKLLNEHK